MKKKLVFIFILVGLLAVPFSVSAETGFNEWGYNYQAHLFNGYYCDAYQNATWCQSWTEDRLIMKWNDAWLSNEDRDNDGKLDRHWGYPSYIGSGAWETNFQSGTYIGDDGKSHTWTYFVKIEAKPTADYVCGNYSIWGEFCVTLEIYNDPYSGYHGILTPPVDPGFGN